MSDLRSDPRRRSALTIEKRGMRAFSICSAVRVSTICVVSAGERLRQRLHVLIEGIVRLAEVAEFFLQRVVVASHLLKHVCDLIQPVEPLRISSQHFCCAAIRSFSIFTACR